jgi:hypothetical protein
MGCKPGQGTQCLKALLADQLGLLNVDGLQNRATGAQGKQCLKAFLADLMRLLNVEGAAAPGSQALKARNA